MVSVQGPGPSEGNSLLLKLNLTCIEVSCSGYKQLSCLNNTFPHSIRVVPELWLL